MSNLNEQLRELKRLIEMAPKGNLSMTCALAKQLIDEAEAARSAPPVPQAAQVQAEPVAWIRLRSDGGYEGPIMDAAMEEVRKKSGAWTPLYSAPAAPQATSDARDAARWRYVLDHLVRVTSSGGSFWLIDVEDIDQAQSTAAATAHIDAALATLGAGKGGAAQEGE